MFSLLVCEWCVPLWFPNVITSSFDFPRSHLFQYINIYSSPEVVFPSSLLIAPSTFHSECCNPASPFASLTSVRPPTSTPTVFRYIGPWKAQTTPTRLCLLHCLLFSPCHTSLSSRHLTTAAGLYHSPCRYSTKYHHPSPQCHSQPTLSALRCCALQHYLPVLHCPQRMGMDFSVMGANIQRSPRHFSPISPPLLCLGLRTLTMLAAFRLLPQPCLPAFSPLPPRYRRRRKVNALLGHPLRRCFPACAPMSPLGLEIEVMTATMQHLRKHDIGQIGYSTPCSSILLPSVYMLHCRMQEVVNCGVVSLEKLPPVKCCVALEVEW